MLQKCAQAWEGLKKVDWLSSIAGNVVGELFTPKCL